MSKPKTVPIATEWLAGYLRDQTTPESRIFRAGRQAGLDHLDIRRAAMTLNVERWPGKVSSWWRMPMPAQQQKETVNG
jgi:hypothetical protein